MLVAELQVAVVMQRGSAEDPDSGGAAGTWRAIAVTTHADHLTPLSAVPQPRWHERIEYVEPSVAVQLHRDECDDARANWDASDPKMMVAWRVRDGVARVLEVSVGRAEAAPMLHDADGADVVPMPPFVHAWLGASLAVHHRAHEERPGERTDARADAHRDRRLDDPLDERIDERVE